MMCPKLSTQNPKVGGKQGLRPQCGGFTLIELLVVMAVIAILMGVLVPALASARMSARKVACMSNLRQIGTAIHSYSMEYRESIPVGPIAPPFLSPADFYPSTGAPTSLVSLRNGKPVALGLLLANHLSNQPEVVFCSDSDQRISTDTELANVGVRQAQCSYYYRHASVTRLFDSRSEPPPTHVPLSNLGKNRDGHAIRALAIDTQFLCPDELADFNVKPRTNHRLKLVNILLADGHVVSCRNADGRFTVDLQNYADIRNAFSKILDALEEADEEM